MKLHASDMTSSSEMSTAIFPLRGAFFERKSSSVTGFSLIEALEKSAVVCVESEGRSAGDETNVMGINA